MQASRPSSSRGVTLLEVTIVAVVLAIMAGSVVPALEQVDEARRSAAADEVARLVGFARDCATASGEPTGAEIDAEADSVTLRRIDHASGDVVAAQDFGGQDRGAVLVAERFPGVGIDAFVNGDGAGGGTVWFAFDGTPQTRDTDGGSPADFTQDATVTLTGARVVTVVRLSGVVE